MWQYTGHRRPDFAIAPGPGQESVWDYPRPPRLEPDARRVEVQFQGQVVAASRRTYRVLETASPPTFYIPPSDIEFEWLVPTSRKSACEWKGVARYWALSSNPAAEVGWSYPTPTQAFEAICDYVCFYPSALACYVDGERVQAQPGLFYGGWVTQEIVGPFKGEPGTQHW
jgi:uncharacterized protein (DUF427 family)